MGTNSIMLDLEDPRSEKIAGVLTNKTSKKILGLLAEKEMSGSELSEKLGVPLNTVGYNLKNLVEAGLVDKANKMFWSSRGKKMELYKVSNRRIIISPKSMIKGLIPAVLATGAIAFVIKIYTENKIALKATDETRSVAAGQAAEAAVSAPSALDVYNTLSNVPNYWTWFLLGGLTALLIFVLLNWKRF